MVMAFTPRINLSAAPVAPARWIQLFQIKVIDRQVLFIPVPEVQLVSFRNGTMMLLPDDAVESPPRAFREVVTKSVEHEDVAAELYRLIHALGGVKAASGTALHPPALDVRGVNFAGSAAMLAGYFYLCANRCSSFLTLCGLKLFPATTNSHLI
jgi:hypothetical protein